MPTKLLSNKVAILLGLALPWLLVPFSFLLTTQPPSTTVALFCLTLVVFFGIKFSLFASIANAISGFMVFVLFFSGHSGSLRIEEEEDFFTAVFFLVTAFVVGHLASRHNRYLHEIRLREKLSNIEIHLLNQLTKAVDQEEVLVAVTNALNDFSDQCQFVRITSQADILRILPEQTAVFSTTKKVTPDLLAKITEDEEQKNIYILHDKQKILAALNMSSASIPNITKDAFLMLMRQANIALERSRLVADLAQEKIAKENELLRSALLSSISHDFRTPLTTMIGATSTVLEMGPQLTQPEVQELLGTVIAEAERLNRYTQNLLDMTRLGFGQLRLERHWISVEEIINSLNKRTRPLLDNIKLQIEIEDNLPLLNVHAALIEQALFNIVDNAIKFSPIGASIVLICRKENQQIALLIADQGPGVSEAERAKVFERFYTAARGDRRKSGSGLGLTICRGMINAHGGQVAIYSNADTNCQPLPDFLPADGCCVKVELPISFQVETP